MITCDIVGSRHIEEFRRKRDQKLHHIAKLHMTKKWILSEYAITAWDEFEGILSRPTEHTGCDFGPSEALLPL